MKRFNPLVALAGIAVLLDLGTGNLAAQQRGPGGGNFDPAEMRQRMLDNARERLEIKSDDEWKVIQPRIEKVMEARRDVGFGGGMGMFGRGGRRGGADGNAAQAGGDNQGARRAFRGGEPSAEAEALQKAIDSNASNDEIKAKLAKVREARKDKEAKLASAQEELKKVLSVKQEATAVLMGFLQ